MTKTERKTLVKAYRILDKYTDAQPVQDLKLHHRMNEAYDGLSTLLYFLESQPPTPPPLLTLKHRLVAFYYKHIIGIQ